MSRWNESNQTEGEDTVKPPPQSDQSDHLDDLNLDNLFNEDLVIQGYDMRS